MLVLAGGIILALMAVGAFGLGIRLMSSTGETAAFVGLGIKLCGFCLAAAAGFLILWLLYKYFQIRNGL